MDDRNRDVMAISERIDRYLAEHRAEVLCPAHLGGEFARVRGGLTRADVEVKRGVGSGDDSKQEIAANEEIHRLGGFRGAVVEEADIRAHRQGSGVNLFQEAQHRGQPFEIGGACGDQCIRAVGESFGGA